MRHHNTKIQVIAHHLKSVSLCRDAWSMQYSNRCMQAVLTMLATQVSVHL